MLNDLPIITKLASGRAGIGTWAYQLQGLLSVTILYFLVSYMSILMYI